MNNPAAKTQGIKKLVTTLYFVINRKYPSLAKRGRGDFMNKTGKHFFLKFPFIPLFQRGSLWYFYYSL